jgi:monoterpene epsilon-lactone hydrolase
MASLEIQWAKARIAHDRCKAGVKDDYYDVRAARESLRALELDLPAGLVEEDVEGAELRLKWVYVPGAQANKRIVYLHGGGYLAGGYHSHRQLVAWLAHETKASVLFVDYRLAPEARFPAALDDASKALEFAYENGPSGLPSAEPLRIFIGGDSAGGGMTIGVRHAGP